MKNYFVEIGLGVQDIEMPMIEVHYLPNRDFLALVRDVRHEDPNLADQFCDGDSLVLPGIDDAGIERHRWFLQRRLKGNVTIIIEFMMSLIFAPYLKMSSDELTNKIKDWDGFVLKVLRGILWFGDEQEAIDSFHKFKE